MALAYDNDDNKYAKPSSSPPVASSMITQLFWLCYFTSLLTLLVYLLLPLSISTKTASEIDLMRRSCRDASSLLSSLSPFLIPDHTTLSVDAAATKLVNIMGVTAAPLGYGGIVGNSLPTSVCQTVNTVTHFFLTLFTTITTLRYTNSPVGIPLCGFPASICISPNHVVCHGIPDETRMVKGDIVNVDVTTISKEGWHGDTSKMWMIGYGALHLEEYDIEDPRLQQDDPYYERAKLAAVTRDALFLGISVVRPGAELEAVGRIIKGYADKHGYAVVREFTGHGIGTKFHEGPRVLHYPPLSSTRPTLLRAGMTMTIEPMLNSHAPDIITLADQWTVTTADQGDSAQWEHTILVTEEGFEVLTLREGEEWPKRVLQIINDVL